MSNRDNTRTGKIKITIEDIVNILFSDRILPEKSVEELRRWLSDPHNREEKSKALYKIFDSDFHYSETHVHARDMWPAIAELLGFDKDLLDTVIRKAEAGPVIVQARKQALRRQIAKIAAAVLIPVTVAVGTWGVLVYRAEQQTIQMVTVSAPGNETKEITLPDGSVVTLSDGSDIVYEAGFKGGRGVELKGHAVFSIVKAIGDDGCRLPFTVSTGGMRVNVLGTVFRVEERESTDISYVALYEGSVDVETGGSTFGLSHGELFTYNKLTGQHTIGLLPAREMSDNGYMPLLRFDNSTLGNLITALEINYGVEAVVSEGIELTRGRFCGDLEGVPVDEAVRLLTKSNTAYSFRYRDGKIIITRK